MNTDSITGAAAPLGGGEAGKAAAAAESLPRIRERGGSPAAAAADIAKSCP